MLTFSIIALIIIINTIHPTLTGGKSRDSSLFIWIYIPTPTNTVRRISIKFPLNLSFFIFFSQLRL